MMTSPASLLHFSHTDLLKFGWTFEIFRFLWNSISHPFHVSDGRTSHLLQFRCYLFSWDFFFFLSVCLILTKYLPRTFSCRTSFSSVLPVASIHRLYPSVVELVTASWSCREMHQPTIIFIANGEHRIQVVFVFLPSLDFLWFETPPEKGRRPVYLFSGCCCCCCCLLW